MWHLCIKQYKRLFLCTEEILGCINSCEQLISEVFVRTISAFKRMMEFLALLTIFFNFMFLYNIRDIFVENTKLCSNLGH